MSLPQDKRILLVFAHPDDEAFGPGGTIVKLCQKNQVFEVFLTKGESGINQITGKKQNDLGPLRKKEAQESAKVLGIKKVFFLNYIDGHLANSLYHQASKKIEKIIDNQKINFLLTYEPRGVSGHIDHIFVSMVTSFVAQKKKLAILYYCLESNQRQAIKDYFIYFPEGYKREETDLEVDISNVIETKIKAIECHQTQAQDGQAIINLLKTSPSYQKEYFLYRDFGDIFIFGTRT
ncbi:MAG: PIG-L family deacetylase [Patescibacteria group bacterium]|nr:PIG-L family deacetylase [Patescibacteria group bacterium]